MPLFPIISIIVPNYNHERFLKQRLDSILSQTFQDIEIILLDDHSTDNSLKTLENYRRAHPQVSHLVVSDSNSGNPFLQWQKGIALARGKYVWIAESDDWCEPQLLETLVPRLEENPDCTVGIVQSYCIKGEGKVAWLSYHRLLEDKMDGREYIQNYLTHGNSIFNASMAVFRKDAYQTLDDGFTRFRLCGDWYFWIQLLLRGNIFISGKVLNYFRKHDRDVSGRAYASGLNFSEEIRILQLLKQENVLGPREFIRLLRQAYRTYSWHRSRLDGDTARQAGREFLAAAGSTVQRSLLLKDRALVSARRNLHRVKQLLKSRG